MHTDNSVDCSVSHPHHRARQVSSSLPHLTNVRVPLLCVNAKDDPFEGTIPYEAAASNEHVMLAVTERGGHVNFIEGLNPMSVDSSWMARVSLNYLKVTIEQMQQRTARVQARS